MPPSPRKYGRIKLSSSFTPPKRSPSISLKALIEPLEQNFDDIFFEIFDPCDSSSESSIHNPVPPLPPARKHHVDFVDLQEGVLRSGCNVKSEKKAGYVTSPTPPRLRAMLGEVVNVRKWIDTTSAPYVPEHIPWSGAPESSFTPWISEGSISVRDGALQRNLRPRQEYRSTIARVENTSEVSVINGANQKSMTVFSSSLRKKLVPEKEQSDRKTKGLPFRASAKSMASDVVDSKLELQNAGSSANGQIDAGVPRTMPGLPALILPTSANNTLESSSSLVSEKQLAIRRGRNPPEPLTLSEHKSYKNDLPYSSIPTLFLDSSPSFSPNNTPTSGLSHDEMISKLKSRCASLRGGHKLLMPSKEEKPLPNPSITSAQQDVVDNIWAFPGDLLNALENDCTAAATFEKTFCDDDPGTVSSCTVVSCSPKSDTTLGDDAVELQISEESRRKIYGPPTAPPSIPLPRPTSTHQRRVRGILKSTKCVRFAILPGEDQIDPCDSLDALPIIVLSDRQDLRPNKRKPLTSSMKNSPRSSHRDEVSNTLPGDSERKADPRRVSESSATRLPPTKASAIPKGRLPVFSLGRHSLGAKTGRETQARVTSLQNEGDKGSVGKDVRVRNSGSQRSRMPVAVQKMFMRFK